MDSPGLIPCFRLTPYTRKSRVRTPVPDNVIRRINPVGTWEVGVSPSTRTSGGPSPTAM